ncbi:MAG: ATP-binding cassette domain-containing protein [Lachnotalea sp.]
MLLRINNLNVQYGKTMALNITEPITIEKGDRIGVIGSNGAGKSTLIKSFLGIANYTGSIDSSITPLDMAVHMQFNEYTNSMATKHVMEAILQTKIKKNQKLQELISYFEFEKCLNKKYKVLSGGQKQRFTIILVMMQDAPLTFYDEVTSGLDFETRQKLVEKLVSWYQGKEAGLCVVSHYYEELEQLTNKLLILEQGKVIAFGDKKELFRKYCGRAIIVIDNNQKNQLLTNKYEKLASSNHLIALACNTQEIESEISNVLIQNNVNFKRSNNDIEMIFINAKKQAVSGGIENE